MIVKSWLGRRNKSPIRSVPDNALVDDGNVKLDDAGILLSRGGYEIAKPMPISSAYSTQERVGYVVSNGWLFLLNQLLVEIKLCPSTATEFTEFGSVLFTNDGWRVDHGLAINLKCETPTSPLVLTKRTGNMPKGRYMATYTYLNADGLESGCAPIAEIILEDNESFVIEIPVNGIVYVTEAGGTVFFDGQGAELPPNNVLTKSFPAICEKIAYFDTKLYASAILGTGQTVVRFSKPYDNHLWDYEADYFIVPGKVQAMMADNSSLIVATDKEIYAYADNALSLLAHYGVPAGRSMAKLPNGQVAIHTDRGECIALPFSNLTEDKCSLPSGNTVSTAFIQDDGINQFIILHDNSGIDNNPNFVF